MTGTRKALTILAEITRWLIELPCDEVPRIVLIVSDDAAVTGWFDTNDLGYLTNGEGSQLAVYGSSSKSWSLVAFGHCLGVIDTEDESKIEAVKNTCVSKHSRVVKIGPPT